MANGWTDERRAKQAAAIRRWKPWQQSTGPRTPEGKARSSRNAFRETIRKYALLMQWLQREHKKYLRGQPPASQADFVRKAAALGIDCADFEGWKG